MTNNLRTKSPLSKFLRANLTIAVSAIQIFASLASAAEPVINSGLRADTVNRSYTDPVPTPPKVKTPDPLNPVTLTPGRKAPPAATKPLIEDNAGIKVQLTLDAQGTFSSQRHGEAQAIQVGFRMGSDGAMIPSSIQEFVRNFEGVNSKGETRDGTKSLGPDGDWMWSSILRQFPPNMGPRIWLKRIRPKFKKI